MRSKSRVGVLNGAPFSLLKTAWQYLSRYLMTDLVRLHTVSDLLIATAYFAIAAVLFRFARKTKQRFPVRFFFPLKLFTVIILCGLGHLCDIAVPGYPASWASAIVRASTALASCYIAIELTIVLPQLLTLKTPFELEAVNQKLERTIADQKSIEKELEESQRVFKGAFEDAPIGMALVSLEGNFTRVNKALLKIVGYSRQELLSTNFQSITHSDDLQEDVSFVNDLMTGGRKFYQLEKRYIHKQGHMVPVQISVALLTDSEDKPLFFIVHIQDISAQKQVNQSLQASTQAAEAANRAKGEFLAMMSHEIRTPMNAMIGMLELLEDTRLDSQQRDFVEIIRTGSNTLSTVVNDILDFSKVESNKLELEMKRLDLYRCVEDVLALFSPQAEEKRIVLTSLIEPANIPVFFRGDSTRLRQILANLVSNSIKFTKQGEVSIQVKVKPIGSEVAEDLSVSCYEIQFSVKDTGIGIPPEKIAHLFKPFSQLDASITRQYGGTGLGLTISKRLVELMGGKVWVKSKPQQGSTFYFSIRLETYDKASNLCFIQSHISLEGKNLLIVDGITTSRTDLLLQAQSWHLNVSTAESAEAAFEKLLHSGKTFDAIVINESPEIDCHCLALQIRNMPNYEAVPFILLQTRQQALSYSLNNSDPQIELLQKPVRRSQFYNALAQLLLKETTILHHDSSKQPLSATASLDKPLRILLTEDILLNQRVALQMLAAYGYSADVATNGKEAIAALQRQPYDLVFMDVQMPEMDGLQATQQIRSNLKIVQPYIVAMTAHTMKGDREECLLAGMNSYIGKPIRKRDLANALQKCPPLAESKPLLKPTSTAQSTAAAAPDLPANPKKLSTLDTQVLESASSDPSFLIEICESFLEDTPQRLAAIVTAIEQNDALALKETAHALKSLSGCVGAMQLFQICQLVEAIGSSDRVEPARSHMTQLKDEYEKVRLAIQSYQNTLQHTL